MSFKVKTRKTFAIELDEVVAASLHKVLEENANKPVEEGDNEAAEIQGDLEDLHAHLSKHFGPKSEATGRGGRKSNAQKLAEEAAAAAESGEAVSSGDSEKASSDKATAATVVNPSPEPAPTPATGAVTETPANSAKRGPVLNVGGKSQAEAAKA